MTLTANDSLAYTRMGNAVTVTGALGLSSVSSPVGFINISLPFAVADTAGTSGRSSVNVGVVGSGTNSAVFQGFTIEGESAVRVYDVSAGTFGVGSGALLSATTSFYINFTYFT